MIESRPAKLEIAIGVVERGVTFAFMQRANGRWTFPSGKVNPGETPEDAVLREIKEETALDAGIRRKLGMHETDDQIRHYYLCDLKGGRLQMMEPEKFLRSSWYMAQTIIDIVGDRLFPPIRTYFNAQIRQLPTMRMERPCWK